MPRTRMRAADHSNAVRSVPRGGVNAADRDNAIDALVQALNHLFLAPADRYYPCIAKLLRERFPAGRTVLNGNRQC